MSTFDPSKWTRVGTLAQLHANPIQQVKGSKPAVTAFLSEGEVFAVDNRCPHMGYPLHRGTVKDGVLTCNWHHANFDLCSGCSFSLFADDVPSYDTHIEDGVVYVSKEPRRKFGKEDYARRLHSGLDQNIPVIIAKSVDLLRQVDPSGRELIREVAMYGSRRHSQAGAGMSCLTIAANLIPVLDEQTAYLTLYKAVKFVANDCHYRSPRMLSEALDTKELGMEALARGFRRWVENGQVTGCERTILTVAQTGATTGQISDLFYQAATDRMYAHAGQGITISNKGFELIEFLGRPYAKDILPLIVRWISSRGSGVEDQSPWQHPIDLITPLRAAEGKIAGWMEQGRGKTFNGIEALKPILLGDDPHRIIDALGEALSQGASPNQLSRLVAYAAGRRLAHFALSNELQDWHAPGHTFNYANAIHQVIKRSPDDPVLVRGLFHGAISVFMDRFLNIPAVRLPGERAALDDMPSDPKELCRLLPDVLDRQSHVEEAARVVARYCKLNHPLGPLFNAMTLATVREDLGLFHWSILESGIHQATEWEEQGCRAEAEHILVGVVRHLAAYCPTPRAQIKSAQVGLRLNMGEKIFEESKA